MEKLIVLDTNIFFDDYYIEGPKFRLLQSGIDKLDINLALPEVVVDELVNKYGEELRKRIDKFEKQMSNIERTHKLKIEVSYKNKKIEENITQYNDYLGKYIKNNKVVVLSYPHISHKEIVLRNLKKQKPFSGKGAGYRDFLIWKSILNKAKKTSINMTLISKNKNDFSDGHGNLHHDLIADMKALSIKDVQIKYYEELDAFNEAFIIPNLEILEEIKEMLQSDTFEKFSINQWLNEKLFTLLNESELNPKDIGFPYEYENPTIASVESIDTINVEEVRKLSESELYVSGKSELFCHFEFFIHKSDYYILDDEEAPEIYDSDWNESYMWGGSISKILFDFTLIIDQNEGDIVSVDFLISPLPQSDT